MMAELNVILEKDTKNREDEKFKYNQMHMIYKTIKSYAENKQLFTNRSFFIPSTISKKFDNADNSSDNIIINKDENDNSDSDIESEYIFDDINEQDDLIVNQLMLDNEIKLNKYRESIECLHIEKTNKVLI